MKKKLIVLLLLIIHNVQAKQRNCNGCKWCIKQIPAQVSKRVKKRYNAKYRLRLYPEINNVVKKEESEQLLAQNLIDAIKHNAPINEMEDLVDRGANLDYTDKEKRTALHWAAIYGLPEVVELLLVHNADVYAIDYRDNTPLHLVVMYRIHTSKRERIIRDLLFAGASIYDRNSMGLNVLEAAVTNQLRTFTLLTSFKRSFIRRIGG